MGAAEQLELRLFEGVGHAYLPTMVGAMLRGFAEHFQVAPGALFFSGPEFEQAGFLNRALFGMLLAISCDGFFQAIT